MKRPIDFIDYKSYLEYCFLQPINKFVNIISKKKFNEIKNEEKQKNILKIKFIEKKKINYKIIIK